MKLLFLLLSQLIVSFLFAQDGITFTEPIKIEATERVNSEVKTGTTLFATGIKYTYNNMATELSFITNNTDGNNVILDSKKISSFKFIELDNIDKVWVKNQLINGTYQNLLINGYQYDLRKGLNDDAVDYINTLSSYDRFFDDEYFEDYLYTIINKIHSGILKDARPGNIFVKIVKDTEPNAFALPNGCIIITTGLLSTIQSEDELAGILAHEIAHFVLDHQVLNYNKAIDRQKRAEFWASFATVVAAGADAYLSVNNRNYIPGVLTASTAIIANSISEEVSTRLGIKYNQAQETEADITAQEILKVINYNSLGLSVTLQRIKNYSIVTGNYLALYSGQTHPDLDFRINSMGKPGNLKEFEQPAFLKKVSFINSYNAWIELWSFSHLQAASDLAGRNISNGIATESDYIVEAIIKRRLSNTKESNEEVLGLLNKAKLLNVTAYIIISKEEGITFIRLNKMTDAKKSFQTYLASLNDLKEKNDKKELNNSTKELEDEISWTQKMIYKVDNL